MELRLWLRLVFHENITCIIVHDELRSYIPMKVLLSFVNRVCNAIVGLQSYELSDSWIIEVDFVPISIYFTRMIDMCAIYPLQIH